MTALWLHPVLDRTQSADVLIPLAPAPLGVTAHLPDDALAAPGASPDAERRCADPAGPRPVRSHRAPAARRGRADLAAFPRRPSVAPRDHLSTGFTAVSPEVTMRGIVTSACPDVR